MYNKVDFKKISLLGTGKKNTKIFKVEHIKTGKIYALKEVEAKSLEKLNEYKEEAYQLTKLQKHPNILQIYGYFISETKHSTYKLGIINEYLEQETNLEITFRKRAKLNNYFTEDNIINMSYSLIDALAYLEYNNICHRDIKPTNLFLMHNFQIKVIDFGESKETSNIYDDYDNEYNPSMATIRGTPQYLSPILWQAHTINQVKQVEHNIYKSDVFSCGLVLFQMCALKDVTGFNQKTEKIDGEKLINNGLKILSNKYSNKVVDLLRIMLKFKEKDRPTFIELAKHIAGNNYIPKVEYSIFDYIINKNNNISNNKTEQIKEKTNEEKAYWFKQYINKEKLIFNLSKSLYWFEAGGNMIGKYNFSDNINEEPKFSLIGKYKGTFPNHFVTIYTNNKYGYFLLGGEENTTYQFINNQVLVKANMLCPRYFTSPIYYNNIILVIGGYDNINKVQLASIECYNIDKNTWNIEEYSLNIPRSQANSLLYKDKIIYVFGGINKNYGTLNSIERINIELKLCDLLNIKLPIPLRRFKSIKITSTKILILGGTSRYQTESEHTFIYDVDTNNFSKFVPLSRAGNIEDEIIVDEIGELHIFLENAYGTSPPYHIDFNYLDFH